MAHELWQKSSKESTPGENRIVARVNEGILRDGRTTDIVIPVMGQTGAGKSTFINTAVQQDLNQVGHTTTSCTTQPFPVVIDRIPGFPALQGYRLVLLDTPGFDDTHVEDIEILQRIAKWLAASYQRQMPIGGVLYLHDISTKQFSGAAHRNLEILSRLCGEAALSRVVLVTTNWEVGASEAHVRREEEMQVIHWQKILAKGAKMCRFHGDSESAWAIVEVLLNRTDTHLNAMEHHLRIQEELVDFGMSVLQTEAGRMLRYTRKRFLELKKEAVTFERRLAVPPNTRATHRYRWDKHFSKFCIIM